MFGLEVGGILQIGDGARHLQDAIVGTRAKALLGHSPFEEPFAIRGQFAECADVARRHLGVAVEFFTRCGEAFELLLAGMDHAVANLRRALRFTGGAHLLIVHGRDINMDVGAVHEWAGNLRNVALDHRGRALAVAGTVIVESAGLRVLSLLKNNSSICLYQRYEEETKGDVL